MARHIRTAADLGAWLCFEDEAGQGLRPPKGRTWGRRGHTPVVRVTAVGSKRVAMAALICTKSGHRSRLIYRIHLDRGPAKDRRKGFKSCRMVRLTSTRTWGSSPCCGNCTSPLPPTTAGARPRRTPASGSTRTPS